MNFGILSHDGVRPVHYVLVCNSACGFILRMIKPHRLIAECLACHSLFFFHHLHSPIQDLLICPTNVSCDVVDVTDSQIHVKSICIKWHMCHTLSTTTCVYSNLILFHFLFEPGRIPYDFD